MQAGWERHVHTRAASVVATTAVTMVEAGGRVWRRKKKRSGGFRPGHDIT